MRFIFFTILVLTVSSSFSQRNTNYRFGFGVSGLSILNYNLKDIENVPSPIQQKYYKVYNTEKYTLDYQNFSFSKGINFNFSAIVLNKSNYFLRINANIFYEKYKDKLTYTLTDIGDGSLVDYGIYTPLFTPEEIPLGYSETVTFTNRNKKAGGIIFDAALFIKLDNNWRLGCGLFYVHRSRYEWYDIKSANSYQPWILPRALNSYNTKQIGISLEAQKTFNRFNAFINISQTIITTKKQQNKGGFEFRDSQPLVPLSQNLDFRFPLVIKAGISVQFGRIKSESYRIITMPPF